MKMKCGKSFIFTAVVLVLVGGRLWYRWNTMANAPVLMVSPEQDGANLFIRSHGRINSSAPPPGSNQTPHDFGFRQKANELSDAEKVEMTNLFVTKLKPAAEKWASVYSNRVPFDLSDLTMDRFVERLGRDSKVYHSYTFVMGDITLGVTEQNGDTAVQYLASRRGLATMRALPTTGAAPDLSMPITHSRSWQWPTRTQACSFHQTNADSYHRLHLVRWQAGRSRMSATW